MNGYRYDIRDLIVGLKWVVIDRHKRFDSGVEMSGYRYDIRDLIVGLKWMVIDKT